LVGALYQDLPTAPGVTYHLRFAMAENFGHDSDKTMDVYWGDTLVASPVFPHTGTHSATDMGWTYFDYDVQATAATTRLNFVSTTTSSPDAGPALDGVSVTPEPATLALLVLGGLGLLGRPRKQVCDLSAPAHRKVLPQKHFHSVRTESAGESSEGLRQLLHRVTP